MDAEVKIQNLFCSDCQRQFVSQKYYERHIKVYHSGDSPTKLLSREKINKWMLDMIRRFQKMYEKSGENIHDVMKNMVFRFVPDVKKSFGEPMNLPVFQCENLKDLLYGTFGTEEEHLWIIFNYFKNKEPLKLLDSNAAQQSEKELLLLPQPLSQSKPTTLDVQRLSQAIKNLESTQLQEVFQIVNENESNILEDYEISVQDLKPSTFWRIVEFIGTNVAKDNTVGTEYDVSNSNAKRPR